LTSPNNSQLTFQRYDVTTDWQPPYSAGPAVKRVEVKNLVITKVSTPIRHRLVGFDPDSGVGATVSFTFDDTTTGDTHYDYTFSFTDTLSEEIGIVEGSVDTPGAVSVSWDGSLPGGYGARRGVYQVRVTVKEMDNATNGETDRAMSFAALLKFDQYDVSYNPEEGKLQATYRILPQEIGVGDASEVNLVSVNSSFQAGPDDSAPTQLTTLHTLDAATPDEGGRIILVGVDDEKARRRDHKGEDFACVNHVNQNKRLWVLDKTGSLDAPGLLPPDIKKLKWNSRGMVWGWTGTSVLDSSGTARNVWESLNTVQNNIEHQIRPNVVYMSAHSSSVVFGPIARDNPDTLAYGYEPDPHYYDLEIATPTPADITKVNLIIMSGCNSAGTRGETDIGLIPASRKGAKCALGFQSFLKPYKQATATEGPFMRGFVEELSMNKLDSALGKWRAKTISEAYQANLSWWKDHVKDVLGFYANPDGESTPYYGYDSGWTFGGTAKLDE